MYFLISILTYCLSLQGMYEAYYPTEAPTYSHQEFRKHSANELYDLHIEYPYIQIENESRRHKINLSIQSIMTAALKDFQQQHKKLQKKGGQNGFNYFKLQYEVISMTESVLSIKFTNKIFLHAEGGEKRNIYTLNIDLESNKLLKIQQLFDGESEQIHQFITALIIEKSNCYCNRSSIYKDFSISEKGIYFYGDDYSCSDNCQKHRTLLTWEELQNLKPKIPVHL